MTCEAAFRIIARRHLATLGACRDATAKGDADALHEMRIALTHLRSAIRLFSPLVDDARRRHVWDELKWLNGELGAVRDLDVTIERIASVHPGQPDGIPHFAAWQHKRAEAYRHLAHALQSARFARMIAGTAAWISGGPWCTIAAKQAARRRGTPVTTFAARRLAAWENKLIRRSRKLRELDARQRHRLRLLNKQISYAIESLAELLDDDALSRQKAALKPLRRAQRDLGQLNDDVNGRRLALALRKQGIAAPLQQLGKRCKKRLLRDAEAAYHKLGRLKLGAKLGAR